jgi:hypothetical protein
MIYFGDDIKQRLTTLNRSAVLDPIKIEHDILMSHSPLVNHPELTSRKFNDPDFKERQTRLNQFLQFCTNEELLISGSIESIISFFND